MEKNSVVAEKKEGAQGKLCLRLRGVNKTFTLTQADETVLSFLTGRVPKKKIHALKDISFDAYEGQVMGIIGKNGSGKTTLLRSIAEIQCIDSGSIYRKGQVTYVSGLSIGIIAKLTMRDNIFLVGFMLGLTRAQIQSKFDAIVDFCGLHRFVDAYVYQFSSGMVTKLVFSIFIHCISQKRSEILLLDEVIGTVGDLEFQEKALEQLDKLIHNGSTVILSGHNLQVMAKHASTLIWMEEGKILKIGDPQEIIAAYSESIYKRN